MIFIDASRLGEGLRVLQGTLPCACNRVVDVLVSDARCFRCLKCGEYFLLDREEEDKYKLVYAPKVTHITPEKASQFNPLIHKV